MLRGLRRPTPRTERARTAKLQPAGMRSASCFGLPVLPDGPNLNRTSQTSRRNARSELYSSVEVFRFERVVPADTPSHVNEGTVRCKRLPILHSHCLGVFRKPERGAWRNTGRVVDLVVLEVDPLLLLVRVRGRPRPLPLVSALCPGKSRERTASLASITDRLCGGP